MQDQKLTVDPWRLVVKEVRENEGSVSIRHSQLQLLDAARDMERAGYLTLIDAFDVGTVHYVRYRQTKKLQSQLAS